MKTALGIFVIAHGLVHSILAVAPNPSDPDTKPGTFFTAVDRSWLLPKLGLGAVGIQWIGIVLVVFSTVGFVVAGMGFLGVVGITTIWRIAAAAASLISILLLILFWHPWLPIGVVINILLLVALLWFERQLLELIGK